MTTCVTDEWVSLPRLRYLYPDAGNCANRQFVIRWKTIYFNSPPGAATAEFEVILTEGSDTLSVIYGDERRQRLDGSQRHPARSECVYVVLLHEDTLTSGLRVDYIATLWGAHADRDGDSHSYSDCYGNATPTATMAPRQLRHRGRAPHRRLARRS